MRRYFGFFLASGFCSLVYETVWVRLAMAQFGVTAASLSIVISVFMGGLALGSWLVSRFRGRLLRLDARSAAILYAMAELLIGLLGLLVPGAMRLGGTALSGALRGSGPVAWYGAALLWQAVILLPATAAMGATIPLGMLAIRRRTSFSYLYLANVLGAIGGALVPAFVLIELLGFRDTLRIAFVLNLAIAALAFARSSAGANEEPLQPEEEPAPAVATAEPSLMPLLFVTGLCSMGMEVVWTRLFTVFLGTVVYSFAAILAIYLAATFAGSALYRALRSRIAAPPGPLVWAVVLALSALPLLASDLSLLGRPEIFEQTMEVRLSALLRVAFGIAPFSAALGFLTPQLVDRYARGRADRAGIAYAVNTVGCIVGPLLAGFFLLPWLSERRTLAIFAAPFLLASALLLRRAPLRRIAPALGCALAALALLFGTHSFDERFPAAQVERDHTATTIAAGKGFNRRLLVNGMGMTVLTPATKMMAHLTLALLPRAPQNALTICFGMGTTFRSLRSWNIPVTAVELVPGVPHLFHYFHEDAPQILASPDAHVVIDDGRRFLESATGLFDVIIVDPPPPVNAASSSLLYSTEFYELAKRRLAPGGVLQQWIPGGDETTIVAMARSFAESFPHTLAFRGQYQGLHLFGSMEPMAQPTAAQLARKLGPAQAADFVEWGPRATAEAQFADVVRRPVDLAKLVAANPGVPALTDDRAINEYDLVRRSLKSSPQKAVAGR
jgi:spermidine synthase